MMMNTEFLPNQGRFGSTTVDNHSSQSAAKNFPFGNFNHNSNNKGKGNFDMSTEFYSPTTITLGNQSANIIRGMTAQGQLLGSTHYHYQQGMPQQQQGVPQQQQQRPPYLPSMRISPTASSRPIRITRRKPAYLNPHPAKTTQALQPLAVNQPTVTGGAPVGAKTVADFDEHLSASPRELKMFYDERTWHMYHLIQTSRLEKEEAKEEDDEEATMEDDGHDFQFQPLPNHHRQHQQLPQDDGMDFLKKDTFFKTAAALQAPPPSTLRPHRALAEVDHYQIDFEDDQEPECVFELDDL